MARPERDARALARRLRDAAARRRAVRRGPLLSVVLVVRGPAGHLGACLDSVLASRHRPLEVLVVADPADPAGAEAAASLPPSRGVRRAPLSGHRPWLDDAVATARGDLLAFVDGDDLVPADGFAALVRCLTGADADVAVGRRKPPPAGRGRSAAWEQPPPERDAAGGEARDLAGSPAVLADLTLTGKVFRLARWRASGLSLPSWHAAAGSVAGAYLAARGGVAVSTATVYEEQARDVSAPVPEQARFDPDVAATRLEGLRAAARLVQRERPALLADWAAAVLTHLLPPLYVDAVGGGPRYLERLAPAADDLLSLARPLSAVPVAARVGAWLAAHGPLEAVALFCDHLADNPDGLPTLTDGQARVVVLPDGLQPEPPRELLRVEPVDGRLRTRAGRLVREGGRLRLDGAAFVDYCADEEPPEVVLGPGGVTMEVHRRTDPRLNLWARRAWEDRSGSGFTAWVDAGVLPPGGDLRLEISLGGRRAGLPVSGPEEPVLPREPGSTVVLSEISLDGDVLSLTGTGGDRPASLRLSGPRGQTARVPVTGGPGALTARVPLRTALFGAQVHLPAGRFEVALETADGERLPCQWSGSLLAAPPELVGARAALTLADDSGRAVVVLGAPLGDCDRSAFGQARLRASVYAAPAPTPYPSTVLLETFRGRSAGDNPGAIGRELVSRDPGLDLVWVTDDPSVEPPEGTRAVARRSREWYDVLARARVYVGNAGAPYWFAKKPGQVHLQTWHGTPLKRIGEDRGPGDFQTWRHRRRIAAQAAGWDALVSPSPFCSRVFRSAFRYDGPMLEVGYPRNDVLRSAEAGAVRTRVRRALGVAEDERVVLYAPTWREYVGVRDSKPLYLDAEALTRRLPDTVVLVRGHYNATTSKDVFAGHPRIKDVTRYPDIADLYLAADTLVTDYSSVMFDFALTDKPLVLLVPDLDQYRDVERGFYFELEDRAPGPLVASTGEVAEVLEGPDGWAPARRRFRDEFCPWDDGRASARVADFLLERLRSEAGRPGVVP
jgi:CDP-glycerol glycerophosphotransferase